MSTVNRRGVQRGGRRRGGRESFAISASAGSTARDGRNCKRLPTPVRFFSVGALGFVVQTAALAVLMSVAHWTWLPATLVAVELAVLHNFFWHERWTWRDQTGARIPSLAALQRLLRFHAANGVVSIAGNAALMALLIAVLECPHSSRTYSRWGS